MTMRLGVTATPNLSLQVYAAPFATRGNFSDWLQVANARAEQWNDRYKPYGGGDRARSTPSISLEHGGALGVSPGLRALLRVGRSAR